MTLLLTIAYIACFQGCAIPSWLRIMRRKSSADLSVWREWLLIVGASLQFAVMTLTHASWLVRVSPLASISSIGLLLIVIYRHRG